MEINLIEYAKNEDNFEMGVFTYEFFPNKNATDSSNTHKISILTGEREIITYECDENGFGNVKHIDSQYDLEYCDGETAIRKFNKYVNKLR